MLPVPSVPYGRITQAGSGGRRRGGSNHEKAGGDRGGSGTRLEVGGYRGKAAGSREVQWKVGWTFEHTVSTFWMNYISRSCDWSKIEYI